MKFFFDRVLLKFMLVGVINTLAGAGLMFLLYNLAGCGYWVSSAANFLAGGVLSFFLNKYFTFEQKAWSIKMIIFFALTVLCSYLLAYGIAKPFVYMLLEARPPKIRDNAALAMGMCLYTGLNYLGQRFIVFAKK
jgi:putative flippase GtrA